MSNPIADKAVNVVLKEGPSRGFLSVAPVPTDTVTDAKRRRFKVLFARKPFAFGEVVRGTLDRNILMDDDIVDPIDLIIKALQQYRKEYPFDSRVWYDELSRVD